MALDETFVKELLEKKMIITRIDGSRCFVPEGIGEGYSSRALRFIADFMDNFNKEHPTTYPDQEDF